jgi:hypothetical protein
LGFCIESWNYPPRRSVKKSITQINTEKSRRSVGLNQRTFSLYPPRRNTEKFHKKNQRFFSSYPPRRSGKKVHADKHGKIPQIYWVESAYFFSLSATAEHGEIPQKKSAVFFFFDQREKKFTQISTEKFRR